MLIYFSVTVTSGDLPPVREPVGKMAGIPGYMMPGMRACLTIRYTVSQWDLPDALVWIITCCVLLNAKSQSVMYNRG